MSADDSLSQDVVFEMLHSPRRRYVLSYLTDQDDPVELDDLIARVAAREFDTSVEALSESERKRMYVSLYQTHVPKLANAGLVEYDDERGTVALTERAADVEHYISEERTQVPWHYAYLALSVIGGAVLLATWVDAPGFGAVAPTAAGSLVVGAFVALTSVVYSASAESDAVGVFSSFRVDR